MVFYYAGDLGTPSRCYAVHVERDGIHHVAAGHIHYAIPSPSMVIEDLCVQLARQFCPDAPLDQICFYDCRAHRRDETSLSDSGTYVTKEVLSSIEILRVRFESYDDGILGEAKWDRSAEIPQEITDILHRNYEAELASAYKP